MRACSDLYCSIHHCVLCIVLCDGQRIDPAGQVTQSEAKFASGVKNLRVRCDVIENNERQWKKKRVFQKCRSLPLKRSV